MKHLARFIFVMLMVFSVSICFANAQLEEATLNIEVLNPIIKHFAESDSYSRLISLELIQMQKEGVPEDGGRMRERLEEKFGREHIAKIFDVDDQICYVHPKAFAMGTLIPVWEKAKPVSCTFYALLVITVLEFNRMNYFVLQKPWLFKEAVLVETRGSATDGHMFVLVEGKSGAMFAVDPWIRRVVKLPDCVTKLSEIHLDPKSEYPEADLLNSLFAQTYNGKVYYDNIFVRKDTQWLINRVDTSYVQQMVHTHDKTMWAFYETPDGIKHKPLALFYTPDDTHKRKFPSWQIKYPQFFEFNVSIVRMPEGPDYTSLEAAAFEPEFRPKVGEAHERKDEKPDSDIKQPDSGVKPGAPSKAMPHKKSCTLKDFRNAWPVGR